MRGIRRSRLASNRRLAVLLLAVVAVGAAAIAITAYATNLLRSLDLNTVNTRFSIRGNERPPKNIVMVEVDDATFQDLNVYPLPRRAYGRVIARIAAEHPAAIAVDIQFSEKSPGTSATATNDEVALLDAIQAAHGAAVFSATEVGAHNNVPFLGSTEGTKLLHEVGSRPADTQFSPAEPGGFDRQFSYSVLGLPTFAVVTAEVATHKHIRQAQFGGGANWIDFVGPGGTFPAVSFSDVYYPHRLAQDFFRGKIVVIGDTSTTDQDFHPTSTDPHMPGVEVQANAIDTVLRGNPLSSAPGWINVVLILLLAAAVPLASLRLGPVAATGLAVALGAMFTVAVQLAFNSGVIVSFIYPLGALILSAGGSLSAQLVTEASERIRVRDLFSRFVPEDVVDEVLASADGLRLGGVQRDGTVMFADLRGFTTLAESLAPARVIEVLNRYLSEMSDAILDHGGTLVAYTGGRDHGRVRRAARASRSCRPGARRCSRDARRAPATVQRMAARGGHQRRLPDGGRAQQRPCHVGPRRIRATRRICRRRGHDQLRRSDRAADEGDASPAAAFGGHQGCPRVAARRSDRGRRNRDPWTRRRDHALVAARGLGGRALGTGPASARPRGVAKRALA